MLIKIWIIQIKDKYVRSPSSWKSSTLRQSMGNVSYFIKNKLGLSPIQNLRLFVI